MPTAIDLDALDLAALLCSRVCHDLISPTGAIVNGLEVLEEKESDEETKTFALDLIKKSAKTASARLQFCRLAFGAAGSAGAQIDLGDAHRWRAGSIEDDKTKLAWNLPHLLLPKNRVKLLLNMLIIAGQRSRAAARSPSTRSGKGRHGLPHRGLRPRCPHPASGAGAARRHIGVRLGRCAHAIQPFYAGLLARACGLKVDLKAEGDAMIVATH